MEIVLTCVPLIYAGVHKSTDFHLWAVLLIPPYTASGACFGSTYTKIDQLV